jgi:hypothetical protein
VGTRFRTLLAPLGVSTGDGRRLAEGGISLADMPIPFVWARANAEGHSGSVPVGAVQQAHIGTVAEAIANEWIGAEAAGSMRSDLMAVWATGEMFDDADRETMPRLAEDVAEVMHLMSAGTLGPSVDLDSFEGVPVMAGSNEPMTEEQFQRHFDLTGEEPKLELLVTSGRVRAATLVSIPAFAETSRPLELLPNESGTPALALIASVGAMVQIPAAWFSRALTGPTPITYDHETGEVFGHIATWQTCHVGFSDVCVVAPRDPTGDYASFNRYPVETADGVVWAGRVTVGGRHASLSANAGGAIAEHDGKRVAAYVRAYEDEFGIAVAGRMVAGIGPDDRAVLARRKVSGDWRETAQGLSLVEVLALAPGPRQHSEPGFPVGTFSRAGRQVALVASLGPEAEPAETDLMRVGEPLDVEALAAQVVVQMEERQARRDAVGALSAILNEETTAARGALLAEINEGAE